MKATSLAPILLLALLLGCSPAAETVDVEAEKEKVLAVLAKHMQADETENLDLYMSVWAPDQDMLNLGMSGERWIGREALREHAVGIWQQFDDTDFTVRDPLVHVDPSGRVAWLSCEFDITGTVQGDPVAISGMRFTAVLQKRDGDWVYVQSHASVAQPAGEG
jgi:uncharacterized protein (TIGR02246 family)